MTTTFADYVAQQDARNTIELNVRKYALMLCDALRDDAPEGYDFIIETGRKYFKVVMDARGFRSVHCFIDRKSGSVLKSASWKSPAKGERYNLLLIKDREWLFENADWASGYLYKK